MNHVWKMLKPAYRREPVFSIVLTAGVVDAVIGGAGGYPSLMVLGLSAVVGAIALRWWVMQRHHSLDSTTRAPIRYLPQRASRPALPMLTASRKSPPN